MQIITFEYSKLSSFILLLVEGRGVEVRKVNQIPYSLLKI